MLKKIITNIFLPNVGEFNGDESHGIEPVKNHLKNKHKFTDQSFTIKINR